MQSAYFSLTDFFFFIFFLPKAIVFYFQFYRFFSQQVRVRGQNKNKIHSDRFPIELKLKETRNCVSFDFNSVGIFFLIFKKMGREGR